jgi:hypothetical protein
MRLRTDLEEPESIYIQGLKTLQHRVVDGVESMRLLTLQLRSLTAILPPPPSFYRSYPRNGKRRHN